MTEVLGKAAATFPVVSTPIGPLVVRRDYHRGSNPSRDKETRPQSWAMLPTSRSTHEDSSAAINMQHPGPTEELTVTPEKRGSSWRKDLLTMLVKASFKAAGHTSVMQA